MFLSKLDCVFTCWIESADPFRGLQACEMGLLSSDPSCCPPLRPDPDGDPTPSRKCGRPYSGAFLATKAHQGAQHTENNKKLTFCKSSMSQNSKNVYFLEIKSPCRVAPNVEEGLRIYPNKIDSFIQKSGKVGFPQKSRIWWKFTYQNSLFTENLNDPYGPYEQLLWDISSN